MFAIGDIKGDDWRFTKCGYSFYLKKDIARVNFYSDIKNKNKYIFFETLEELIKYLTSYKVKV